MTDRRGAASGRVQRAKRYRLLFTLAALLLSAAPSSADARWNILTSGALTILGDQSPATLRDVALQIEQFRFVVGGLIRDADRPLSIPTVVFVVGSRKALEPLVPLYKGKPATIAGYFGQGQDSNYIVLCLEGFDESTLITYHEYTHLLVRNAVRTLPVWLNEGLAEYYSTYRLIERGKAAVIGRAMAEHIMLLRQRYLPIAELIEVDPSSPMYNEGERRSIFYAESWALTHYLMVAKPKGGEQINQYVGAIAEGRTTGEAFRQAFGLSPAQMDKELQDYLHGLTFKEYRFTFADKLTVAEPGPARPLTANEVDAWVGDAQRRVHRASEGGPRIERAAAVDPDSAATQMALGLLRLSQENAADALAAFGRAAALAPNDFLTQFVCGVSRVRADPRASDEQRTQALATLKQATALNGTSSDAYAMLAYVQMLSESTLTEARASIERAVLLAPGRLDYRLRYADITMLQGDENAAKRVLTPIAAIRSDSVSSAAAKERLERIEQYERDRQRVLARRSAEATGDGSATTGTTSGTAANAATTTREGRAPADPADEYLRKDGKDSRSGFLLRAIGPGEERAFGQLTRIDCAPDTVRFTVEAGDRRIVASAGKMEDVELTAFLDDKAFTISCGARSSPDRVYVTWRPDSRWGTEVNGTAVAVEFVPKSFRP
jgi:tetratricopeptide (TPR) repeat protein